MLVTVYIPTRNRVDSLAAAARSVLRQTYREIELIIVNDGSQDNTQAFLYDLVDSDARVKVINNSMSVGAPAARNAAIRVAHGEFITGLDDDDLFEPIRIEAFVKAWEMFLDVGATTSCLFAQDKWKVGSSIISSTSRQGSITHADMPTRNHVGSQVYAPKQSYMDAGLFDESLPAWQDFEFFYRIIKAFGPARLVDVPTYVFDVSPRADRISVNEAKIRDAYRYICQKHFAGAPHDRQRLALQIFSDYYGIRPSLSDLCKFASEGRWLKGLFQMIVASIPRTSKPLVRSTL